MRRLTPLHLRRRTTQVQPLANASGKGQPPLGLLENTSYDTTSAKLAPRDLVMLFTDGLYEVEDKNGELYSQAMLFAQVQKRFDLPAPQLFDGLLDEIKRFCAGTEFADDVCIVGLEVAPE